MAAAFSEMSDAWLVGRARELIALAQRSDRQEQFTAVHEADELLAEARRRGEPWMLAQVLRAAVVTRLVTPGLVHEINPLLDELLVHTQQHGLVVLEADTYVLRARRDLLVGDEDGALSATATALAILDDDLQPDPQLGRRAWDRLLAQVLVTVALVLTQLGVYEMADEVMTRAQPCVRDSGGPHEIALHLINRTRMLVGWGLRLERVGRFEEARYRFTKASAIAVSVEGPWRESLFPRRGDRTAAEQMPVLGAAHALARPGGEHLPLLQSLLDESTYPREQIIVSIALARCLEQEGRILEAAEVLGKVLGDVEGDNSEPALWLSLVREFARLAEPGPETSSALERYAKALENELWALRQARIATLSARREHERLSREHGAIAQQALQDPLTGLPNRRALDDRLDALVAAVPHQQLAVALVDLDGFKEVNDQRSHATGDAVLRVVAATLREALRADDMVARYGGDEFVVLLPSASLSAAEAALNRAVQAVAALPSDKAHGVTLSVGVVAAQPDETGGQVLARADAAMYRAKRSGGNRVAAAGDDDDNLDIVTPDHLLRSPLLPPNTPPGAP